MVGGSDWTLLMCDVCMELTSESVESTSLPLKGVNDIHGGDGLSLGVFGVGDGVSDHILEEYFEYTTSFFVDETRNTFDSSTSGQTTDGGFGDTLDVITEHLSVSLGASLSESFASFTTSSHDEVISANDGSSHRCSSFIHARRTKRYWVDIVQCQSATKVPAAVYIKAGTCEDRTIRFIHHGSYQANRS